LKLTELLGLKLTELLEISATSVCGTLRELKEKKRRKSKILYGQT